MDSKHPDFDGPQWEAGTHLCEACRELDEEMDRVSKSKGKKEGLSVRLYRRGI